MTHSTRKSPLSKRDFRQRLSDSVCKTSSRFPDIQHHAVTKNTRQCNGEHDRNVYKCHLPTNNQEKNVLRRQKTYRCENTENQTHSIRYADSVLKTVEHREEENFDRSPQKIHNRIPDKNDYQLATKCPTVPQSLQTSAHGKSKE